MSPASAGSIGMSSGLLVGVPDSYEVSRSDTAVVGKGSAFISLRISNEAGQNTGHNGWTDSVCCDGELAVVTRVLIVSGPLFPKMVY